MNVFDRYDDTLVWRRGHEIVHIEPWGQDSLRVRSTVGPEIRDDLPGALLLPELAMPTVEVGMTGAVVTNGKLVAQVHADGRIRFGSAMTGAELLAERPQHYAWPPARHFQPAGGDLWRVEASFRAYPGERLYGLGQHQHGLLDQKGCVVDLIQRNTEVSIPFLLSSRGYGFLWNNPAVGRVELAANGTRWIAEATPQIDYWITVGDTPAEILEHYADATGHPPLLPDWAVGFWQSKLRYRNQDELLAVAREHRRRGLPLSVIVVDFFHWTLMGDWQFDPQHWPDIPGMMEELADLDVKVMVSVWPTVNALSPNFAEMRGRGLLVEVERGVPAHRVFQDNQPEGPAYLHFYDATSPEARRYLWDRLRQGYYEHGIRIFWLDACEPEMYPMDAANLRYHLGNGLAVTNIYPLLHAQAIFDGMRKEGEEEIITLCRSAWAGSQRVGAAVWSGDIPSTFEALQVQVRAGLNIALSGIPWWTTDIGGFHDGDPQSPYFRELIVRWFQYGVFCPLFRLHGHRAPAEIDSGGPNEVWSFGADAYAIIREQLFLRERLRPYIMTQMRVAHRKGLPPMRPLFVDFPEDDAAWDVDDEFMFGPDILVAPVLAKDVRSRVVYLPAGTGWVDVWTSEPKAGGQSLEAEAPLERIPIYQRQGTNLRIRA